jgi:hypothetical protein
MPFYYIRWTNFSCPYCRHVFNNSLSASPVRLGPGFRICPKCMRSFQDWSKEWSAQSRWKKIEFFLPPGNLVWIDSALLTMFLPLYVWRKDLTLADFVFVLLIAGLLLIPFLVSCGLRTGEVVRSKRRVIRS